MVEKLFNNEISFVNGGISHYCICFDLDNKVAAQLLYPDASRYCPNKTIEWRATEDRCSDICSIWSEKKYWGLLVATEPNGYCKESCPAPPS